MKNVLGILAICIPLAGCGAPTDDPEESAPARSSSVVGDFEEADDSQTDAASYPSGDPVLEGYPLVVSAESVDYRVSAWMDGHDQLVALAPGVYAPYNPVETDLFAYFDTPVEGDCMAIEKFFPNIGSTCWSGVQPGNEEPAI